MHFNFYLLKGIRILLFPFSLLVAVVIALKNKLYDWKILKSTTFNLPIICVGNISAGGTGKSPMTELIISYTKPHFNVATLSRGYKRKTKGYLLANENTSALEIGDEPMQFHLKHPDIAVCVGEERILAIPQLLHDRPNTNLIILDDAFQHRAIKAGLNIVLTDYNNPYWYDWFLPTGDLRDLRSSMRRAEVIVVTKCPPELNAEKTKQILEVINPLPLQKVFFATLSYGVPYHIISHQEKKLDTETEVLLVCGIANPAPLKQYVENETGVYHLLSYPDHYIFSVDDMHNIRDKYQAMEGAKKLILTTEKDAVRLLKYGEQLKEIPLYVIPVKHTILFEEEEAFKNIVVQFVKQFNTSPTP